MSDHRTTPEERNVLRSASGGRSHLYLEDQTAEVKGTIEKLAQRGLLESHPRLTGGHQGRTLVSTTQAGRDALAAHGDTSY